MSIPISQFIPIPLPFFGVLHLFSVSVSLSTLQVSLPGYFLSPHGKLGVLHLLKSGNVSVLNSRDFPTVHSWSGRSQGLNAVLYNHEAYLLGSHIVLDSTVFPTIPIDCRL